MCYAAKFPNKPDYFAITLNRMEQRGIIFNGDMVRAIIDGRKTVTRRIIGQVPRLIMGEWPLSNCYTDKNHRHWLDIQTSIDKSHDEIFCPHGKPGDLLWVRETWSEVDHGIFVYRADVEKENNSIKWRPSIHMPRKAARLILEITDVRVERLQTITVEDCCLEGIDYKVDFKSDFMHLWDSIYKNEYSWDKNPWVWVIEFQLICHGRK